MGCRPPGLHPQYLVSLEPGNARVPWRMRLGCHGMSWTSSNSDHKQSFFSIFINLPTLFIFIVPSLLVRMHTPKIWTRPHRERHIGATKGCTFARDRHVIWESIFPSRHGRCVPRFWRAKEVHLTASIPALCWLNSSELVVVLRDMYAATRCKDEEMDKQILKH